MPRVVEAVSECHDDVLEKFIEVEVRDELMMAARQGTLDLKITPVYCGSAFKDRACRPC